MMKEISRIQSVRRNKLRNLVITTKCDREKGNGEDKETNTLMTAVWGNSNKNTELIRFFDDVTGRTMTTNTYLHVIIISIIILLLGYNLNHFYFSTFLIGLPCCYIHFVLLLI